MRVFYQLYATIMNHKAPVATDNNLIARVQYLFTKQKQPGSL